MKFSRVRGPIWSTSTGSRRLSPLSERNQASIREDQGDRPGHHVTNHRLSLASVAIITQKPHLSPPNSRPKTRLSCRHPLSHNIMWRTSEPNWPGGDVGLRRFQVWNLQDPFQKAFRLLRFQPTVGGLYGERDDGSKSLIRQKTGRCCKVVNKSSRSRVFKMIVCSEVDTVSCLSEEDPFL